MGMLWGYFTDSPNTEVKKVTMGKGERTGRIRKSMCAESERSQGIKGEREREGENKMNV